MTAGQRRVAAEQTKSRAAQLVSSLAADHPDFKKVKQEVFARNSSSNRKSMLDAAAASTGAASVFDPPPSSPFALADQTPPCSRFYVRRLDSFFRRQGVQICTLCRHSSGPEHLSLATARKADTGPWQERPRLQGVVLRSSRRRLGSGVGVFGACVGTMKRRGARRRSTSGRKTAGGNAPLHLSILSLKFLHFLPVP